MADADGGAQGLEKLITEFGSLVGTLADNIETTLRGNGQDSDAHIAETLKKTLAIQTGALAANYSEAIKGLTPDNRALIDRRADETGGLELARMTRERLAKREFDLSGVIDLLEPIKKIANLIIDVLRKLGVSGKVIDWIEFLLPIINNLMEVLNGLLGVEGEHRAARAHATMNRHLREFYQTQTARLALQRAQGLMPEARSETGAPA